jgi:hypothetical protein
LRQPLGALAASNGELNEPVCCLVAHLWWLNVLPRAEMRNPCRDVGVHTYYEERLRVDAANHGVLTRTSAWDGRPWSWPYLVRNMECVQWAALAVAILGHTNHLILDVVLV